MFLESAIQQRYLEEFPEYYQCEFVIVDCYETEAKQALELSYGLIAMMSSTFYN